ncbi:hypothetical protein HMPREF4655_20227 [Helicobacter pylori 35A]|nr:hypothetical protein HMPREF4655_20227 [Helicobacter pylori 35A]
MPLLCFPLLRFMACPSFTPYLNIGRYKILQQTRFKALQYKPP